MGIRVGTGNLVGRAVKSNISDTLGKILGGFVIAAGFMFVIGFFGFFMAWPVMKLWNGCLVPAVSILHVISWKQAWGIMFVCSILFKTSVSTSSKDKK
jgi:hypothetical protein